MPALHIRDISDTLMKELKVGAAESGLTLKQYVVERLEQIFTIERLGLVDMKHLKERNF